MVVSEVCFSRKGKNIMLKKMRIEKKLHILVTNDPAKNIYAAHCLDMDIAAQGKTSAEAVSELKELIAVQADYCFEQDMLDTLFRPAPKIYWDMFYRSQANEILNELSLHNKQTVIKNLTQNLELAYA